MIVDMNGKIITTFDAVNGTNEVVVNCKDWPPGIYLYGMQVEDIYLEYKKMIVK